MHHSVSNGSCSPESLDWRIGLLAQLRGKDLKHFPLQARIEKTLHFVSTASLNNRARALVRGQSLAFASVVKSFVQSGLITVQDSRDLRLQCRIELQDDRPLPRKELPAMQGNWCKPKFS